MRLSLGLILAPTALMLFAPPSLANDFNSNGAIRSHGTITTRMLGPLSPDPGRQIASVRVDYVLSHRFELRDEATTTVNFGAAAMTPGDVGSVRFGTLQNGLCAIDETKYAKHEFRIGSGAAAPATAVWSRDATSVELVSTGMRALDQSGPNCVVANLRYRDGVQNREVVIDQFSGPLTYDFGTFEPALQGRAEVVRGRWSLSELELSNKGTFRGDVTVSGRGSGYRVPAIRVSEISRAGRSIDLPIRLEGNRIPKRLSLTVKSRRGSTQIKVPTAARRASAAPADGRYEGAGSTMFTVSDGRIIGLRTRVRSRCQYGPNLDPTYTPFTYSVADLTVYANGRAYGADSGRGAAVRAKLRFERAGRVRGEITAATATCAGRSKFSAVRAG